MMKYVVFVIMVASSISASNLPRYEGLADNRELTPLEIQMSTLVLQKNIAEERMKEAKRHLENKDYSAAERALEHGEEFNYMLLSSCDQMVAAVKCIAGCHKSHIDGLKWRLEREKAKAAPIIEDTSKEK